MTKNDLPSLRQLAANGQILYSQHATKRLIERGLLTDEVEALLTSSTNQLIETQPPCYIPGKYHKDEHYVISDPYFKPETAIVIALDFSDPQAPEILVITAELISDAKWDKDYAKDPWIVRK